MSAKKTSAKKAAKPAGEKAASKPDGKAPASGGETKTEKPTDPRASAPQATGGDPAKVREKLGEPAPTEGAKVDLKTGRTEAPAAGTFSANSRKPQTA